MDTHDDTSDPGRDAAARTDWHRRWWVRTLAAVSAAAVFIVAGALGALGEQLKDKLFGWLHPDEAPLPALVVVGPESGSGSVDWLPARAAILAVSDQQRGTIVHGRLRLELLSDASIDTMNRPILRRLCSQRDVVGVIGFVWTNAARAAIEENAGCREPLPLILVGATGDDLTQRRRASSMERLPILQMPFSNVFQARQITLGLADTHAGAERVRGVVLYTRENFDYSERLAGQIKTLAERYRRAELDLEVHAYDQSSWTRVIQTYDLGPSDVVVFVGNYRPEGFKLLRGRAPGTRPLLIVTDGMVNHEFLNNPGALCAWGSYPVAPAQQDSAGDVIEPPTFADFATTAVNLVDQWVHTLERLDPGAPLSRASLRAFVDSISQREVVVPLDHMPGTVVRFSQDGNRRELNLDAMLTWSDNYHLLQVRRGREPNARRWHHRLFRTSLHEC